MAQRYLQAARDDLASKEAEKPRSHRQRPADRDGQPTLADLAPSIGGSTIVHAILLAVVLTLAAVISIWCYVVMDTLFVVGRVMALPTGVVAIVALSYASACYLGIIESTSHGFTTPDDALSGDWRDWVWTVPSTVGMLAIAAALGYAISRIAPAATWQIVGVTVLLVYPVLQLSTLETGSPTAPISPAVFSTLATRPLIWMTLYGASFVLATFVGTIAYAAWRDPPYATMLIMGPIATATLLVYAWLLGQVARWLTIGGR